MYTFISFHIVHITQRVPFFLQKSARLHIDFYFLQQFNKQQVN